MSSQQKQTCITKQSMLSYPELYDIKYKLQYVNYLKNKDIELLKRKMKD